MASDLLQSIQASMPGFSKGQRAIARFLTEHYDKAAFMTASKLGATVGVSESTVVRFASEIGFEGYPQLQKALQKLIQNRLTSVQRIEVTSNRIGNADILETVLTGDMEKIRKTLEEISRPDFEGSIDSILRAKNIYVLGARSSSALAGFLSFYLNLILENVRLISTTSASEIFEQMLRVGEQDVVIGISFPRYSKRTLSALRFAHDRGATVVGITDSQQSPMAESADFLLPARSDMASFVDSLVAPLSLLNALIVALGLRKREEVSKTFSELEYIWDEYDVYEKNDPIAGEQETR